MFRLFEWRQVARVLHDSERGSGDASEDFLVLLLQRVLPVVVTGEDKRRDGNLAHFVANTCFILVHIPRITRLLPFV